jgi:hypothetical protein
VNVCLWFLITSVYVVELPGVQRVVLQRVGGHTDNGGGSKRKDQRGYILDVEIQVTV